MTSSKRPASHQSSTPKKSPASTRKQTGKSATRSASTKPAARKASTAKKKPATKSATPRASKPAAKKSSPSRTNATRSATRSRNTRAAKKQPTVFSKLYDAFCSFATFLGHVSKRALIVGCVAVALAVGAIGTFATTEARVQADLDGLPSYITEDMVSEARSMQAHYGHPAGCTIAQIIVESGYQGGLSQLAAQDHNLFGMKWANSFAGADGVVGPANWDTNEEYDGQYVQINDAFIEFESDRACIRFRSEVFLQASIYANNALIQQAIADHDSKAMAYGLQDAGWATDSNYAATLIAVMDMYDLYRFDV